VEAQSREVLDGSLLQQLEERIYPFRTDHPGLLLKSEMDGFHPRVTCQECPSCSHLVQGKRALPATILRIKIHLGTDSHKTNIARRLESEANILKATTSLMLQHLDAKFGSRKTSNPLAPQTFCGVCPWTYTMTDRIGVSLLLGSCKAHLETKWYLNRVIRWKQEDL